MSNSKWLVIVGLLVAAAGTGVWYVTSEAQSLLDAGPYNSMTLGAGTDVDRCVNWDLSSADATFCYDDGGGFGSADVLKMTGFPLQVNADIFMSDATPSMTFVDSDASSVASGAFTVNATDTTGGSEDGQFDFSVVSNGSSNTLANLSVTTNSNPVFGLSKTSTTARFGYTGASQYVFVSLSTGELTGFDVISSNLVVGGTAPTYVWIKSPDGTCWRIEAADTTGILSTTSQTCPTVTP